MLKRPDFLISLLLAFFTVAVYWQVNDFEFVALDDDAYVYDNRNVQAGLTQGSIHWAFTTHHTGNWHPLTWLSHMLVCHFHGSNPGAHHLFNLVLHLANAILLYLVLRIITAAPWRSGFLAALFALHPMHVESVAWISERKDVLSAFFWMLTMLGYAWYVRHPSIGRYLLVALFFVLGLLSKPMLVTLPFVLLLIDFYPLERYKPGATDRAGVSGQGVSIQRLILEKIPLFALAALSCIATFLAQKAEGAVGTLQATSLYERTANAAVSYVDYIGKMFYPADLAVLYPFPSTIPAWKIIGACLLLAAITAAAFRVRRDHPYFIVGWLWFLGTLVPVIGLVKVGVQSMADRYTYIPYIGLFFMIAWGAPGLLKQRKELCRFLFVPAVACLAACAILSFNQAKLWKNSRALFEHTLKVTSSNWLVHLSYGIVLLDQGDTQEAAAHCSKAIKIRPDYDKAHFTMGMVRERENKLEEAVDHYRAALQINPKFELAHNNIGIVLARQGRTDEAVAHFHEALRIKPDFERAHYNLGIALLEQGKVDEAIVRFRETLRIAPYFSQARTHLDRALKMKQQE